MCSRLCNETNNGNTFKRMTEQQFIDLTLLTEQIIDSY